MDGTILYCEVYTDLIYKIKRSSESKENIIHHDRLKPFFGKCKHWRQEGTKIFRQRRNLWSLKKKEKIHVINRITAEVQDKEEHQNIL
jgi:hypothetical protein